MVLMVRVDVNGGVPDCGLKVGVAPEGNPDIESVTG